MKKIFSVLLALAMMLALTPSAILAEAYLNATTYYYQINTEQDLVDFAQQLNAQSPSHMEGRVELTTDLFMNNLPSYNWLSGRFKGTFNGNGHTIYGLDSQTGGLFAELEGGGKIFDLTLKDAQIHTTASTAPGSGYCGAFADSCAGVIENCYLTGSSVVDSDGAAVGGIVGILNGDAYEYYIDEEATQGPTPYEGFENDPDKVAVSMIRSCETGPEVTVKNLYNQTVVGTISTASPVVEQYGLAGGIVGITHPGFIEHCVNRAAVSGMRPGGILAEATCETTIRFCTNYGDINQDETIHWAAEAAMNNSTPFQQVVNLVYNGDYGEAAIDQYPLGAGGILGLALSITAAQVTIQNCMNYGSVIGIVNVGGIAGMLETYLAQIVNCGCDKKESHGFSNDDYYMVYGNVIGGSFNVGGLVGYMASGYDGGYYYTTTSTRNASGYAASRSIPEVGLIIYNSYNSAPFAQGTEYTYAPTDAVFGGLIGRAGEGVSIENCHNAGLPVVERYDAGDPMNAVVAASKFGSLIGYSAAQNVYITHSYGCVNLDKNWMDLIGDYQPGGIYLDAQYCTDVGAYALDASTINQIYPSTPGCGGVILSINQPFNAPVMQTPSTGVLTGNNLVLTELEAYVRNYRFSIVDPVAAMNINNVPIAQNWCVWIHAAFLHWYCAEPLNLHGQGITQDCEEYAIFHGSFENPDPLTFHAPGYDSPNSYPTYGLPALPSNVIWSPINGQPAIVITPAVVVSHSLTLNGDIGVNFYVSVPFASEDAFGKFQFGSSTFEVPIDLTKYQISTEGEKLYKFTCFVNASQISTQITGTVTNHVIMEDASIDEWVESETLTYSVNQYLNEIANHPYYQNQPVLMDLMRALSVYGFYANELLHTVSDFERSVLFDDSDLDTITADALFEYQANMQDYGDAISYYGSSLLLQSKTSIKHYFTVDEDLLAMQGITLDDFAFLCEGPDGEFDLTPVRNGNYYSVEIPNIESGHLGQNYTVRVLGPVTDPDVDPLAAEWNYSALSYAYTVLHAAEQGGNVSDAQVQLSQALAIYYNCAHAYFG